MSERTGRRRTATLVLVAFLAGMLLVYLLVRGGGHHPVKISIDTEAHELVVDPETTIIRYLPGDYRISREYRVRWTVSAADLGRGQRVVITAKEGVNAHLFGDEYRLWRGALFRNLSVSSGYPRSEPVWQGYVDPRTQEEVWLDGQGGKEAASAEEVTAAARALEEEIGEHVSRLARWRYNVEVFDANDQRLLFYDPEIIIKECP